MKKRILMIIPPSPGNKRISRFIDCSQEAKANYLYQPIELMIITSHLKREDEVLFVDGTVDCLSGKEFLSRVETMKGDIVFFAMSSICWSSDYSYFQKITKMFYKLPIFVISDICLDQQYSSIVLKECNGLIVNPYILDLVKMIESDTGCRKQSLPGIYTRREEEPFCVEKKINYISSSVPRHEIFLKDGYLHPFAKRRKHSTIMTMFGCPFSCSYCPTSNFAPAVRYPKDIVKELDYLSYLNIKELYFSDRTFGFPYENSMELLKEMVRRYKFSWSCFLHPKLYKPELLEMMYAAGCHTVNIGIDSVDLQSMNRYKRFVGVDEINDLICNANRLKMNICADFILGLEHEKEQDIINTIDYAVKLPIDYASFNIAAPLPGSDIRRNIVSSKEKELYAQDGLDTSGRGEILGNNKIDSNRLRELREMAIKKFYMRPAYIFRRLGRIESIEHLSIQFNSMLALFKKT